jgi:guanylate kinase
MKQGKIIIISGPSGSGKTTLYRELLANRKIKKEIVKTLSVTTRPKRPGEKHGRDYFFVSQKMFQYKKRNGHFLETEKVFDNYYGTPKKTVQDILKTGKNVLLCIDVKGARTVRRKFPKAVAVFIKTSSLKVLASRLKGRGSEKKDIMRIRLRTAQAELKEIKNYDHVIINDNLRTAYARLEAIIKAELAQGAGKGL